MTTLAEFLKEQVERQRSEAPERERKREEWVQAVERLIRQVEQWLRQADPGRVLEVKRKEVEKKEHGVGIYTAPALAIELAARRVEVTPVARNVLGPMTDEGISTARSQGRVDITDGVRKYMLYRYVDEGGERWIMIDDEDYRPASFDQKTFEAALLSLLK